MRIALTGNPNSGKTTMYNALTGRNEKVGNWAGVTVEKKEYPIKKSYYAGGEQLIAVDLPGAYSMSPFTSEESITSSYVKKENPDVIINIVDSTNLSRSLFFTTQLLELGIPVVVALNKSDVNKKKETKIDAEKLSEKLGCPVVETVSISAEGLFWGLTSALGIAIYTILPARFLSKYPTQALMGVGMLAGGLITGFVIDFPSISFQLDTYGIVALVLIILLGTIAAFMLYMQGVADLGSVKASMIACVEPISAAVFSVVFFGTQFALMDYLGFACILATIFILGRR